MTRRFLFLLTLLPLLVACQTSKKAALEAQNKPLIETRWEVSHINGTPLDAKTPVQPFIVFDTLGKYHGNFGCNKFFGSFYVKEKKHKLELTYAGATKRLCQYMETERLLSKTLRSEKLSYNIQGDTMRLYSNDVEIIRFVATENKIEPEE